jgi:hypothetical protein
MIVNSLRGRVIALLTICVLAVGGVVAYITLSRAHQTAARAAVSPAAQTTLGAVTSGPAHRVPEHESPP